MAIKCKVCALDSQRRELVDSALFAFKRGEITLVEIAARSGVHESSLYRHSQRHLSSSPANAVATLTAVAPQVPAVSPASPPTKEELLARLEGIWREVVSSVSESKRIGDLHVRAGLLREARRTLELQGDWSGHFPRRIVGNEPGCLVTLVVPQTLPGAPEPEVIEIGLPRRPR
jgi:hypothetical protein